MHRTLAAAAAVVMTTVLQQRRVQMALLLQNANQRRMRGAPSNLPMGLKERRRRRRRMHRAGCMVDCGGAPLPAVAPDAACRSSTGTSLAEVQELGEGGTREGTAEVMRWWW